MVVITVCVCYPSRSRSSSLPSPPPSSFVVRVWQVFDLDGRVLPRFRNPFTSHSIVYTVWGAITNPGPQVAYIYVSPVPATVAAGPNAVYTYFPGVVQAWRQPSGALGLRGFGPDGGPVTATSGNCGSLVPGPLVLEVRTSSVILRQPGCPSISIPVGVPAPFFVFAGGAGGLPLLSWVSATPSSWCAAFLCVWRSSMRCLCVCMCMCVRMSVCAIEVGALREHVHPCARA